MQFTAHYQVNATIPAGVPTGDSVPLTVTVGQVTIPIQ
jgi:uncharacterized protein (TIGR03437 family)